MEDWDEETKGELDHELDEEEEEENPSDGDSEYTSSFARIARSAPSPRALLGALDPSSSSTSSSTPFTAAHQILAMPSFISTGSASFMKGTSRGEAPRADADGEDDDDGPRSPALHLHPPPHQSNINLFNLDQILHLPSIRPSPSRIGSSSSSSTLAPSPSAPATPAPSSTSTSSSKSSEADGRSNLFVAAFYGNERDVMALMEAGADPNETDKHGWTPLALAGTRGLRADATRGSLGR